jgi:acyl-coenzyme A synthetase/AMP-(fatty) acid ligase
MPEVDACHVFAKSDPILGNVVACEITTRSSDDMHTWKRRIRSHCRGRLAAWKIPTQVHIKAHLGLTDRLKRA